MNATGDLVITRAEVRAGGRRVAFLRYSGRVITVVLPSGRTAGRLLPVGYMSGDASDSHFDVWTAKHPAVHTPSDRQQAYGLELDDAIRYLLREHA